MVWCRSVALNLKKNNENRDDKLSLGRQETVGETKEDGYCLPNQAAINRG